MSPLRGFSHNHRRRGIFMAKLYKFLYIPKKSSNFAGWNKTIIFVLMYMYLISSSLCKVIIYKLTQIHYQMQADIYPDLSGRGDITQSWFAGSTCISLPKNIWTIFENICWIKEFLFIFVKYYCLFLCINFGNDIRVNPNCLSNESRDLLRFIGTGRHNSILSRWVNLYIIA